MPRPSSVTSVDPTLITSRRAVATIDVVPGAFMALSGERFGRMRFQPALHGIDEITAAFATDRSDGEYRTLPSVRLDERRDARLAFVGVDQVHLVQHQPARLVVQRAV